jgi:type II restriction/modification system DNA methylase subunit YeeA
MNRAKLKNYAPQARRDFIRAVTDRAAYYGLTAKKVEPVTEKGDVAIIEGRAFPRSVAAKRKALEERIKRQGFEQVMEAMAYTWFNRLVAIRFMELHGYLDHGYRVLSHTEGKTTPEILEYAEHADLPGLDRNKVIELKLDGNKEAELYRMLLIAQCNALHRAMPFLFERIDDETELLLPDTLLHSGSLIRKLVGEIEEEDWQQVEIIGWLYQFYISEKKDQVIGKVVKSEDIPAATQLFTPNWIVKYMVQNSAGRMWLQTYPNSSLRSKMEYYIEPAEQTEEVKAQLAAITPESIDPETITILDPACGSGHILVEAYDLLKEIYLERGYRLRDIPRLILSKNLFGLDIDDRAAQLAGFALLMKARADDRRIFEGDGPPLNVFAIQESAGLNGAELADALLHMKSSTRAVPIVGGDSLFDDLSNQPALVVREAEIAAKANETASREDVIELVELFKQGKTFGSLISVPKSLEQKLPAIAQLVSENLHSGNLYARETASRLLPFMQQAEVLACKYDCVIANPPYLSNRGMNSTIKDFAKSYFPTTKSDLFAMFIERNLEMTKNDGFLGFMTPFVWMFLSSYEKVRHLLTSEKTICSLVRPEYHAFFESAFVPICSFVVFNGISNSKGSFFDLSRFYGSDLQPIKLLEAINNPNCGWHYQASSKDFKKIPTCPIAYWVTDKVREVFEKGALLQDVGECRQGLATSDNDRFLRRWFEISISKMGKALATREEATLSRMKWFPYSKGGDFRKWFGNNEYVINWENDGQEVINYAASLYGSPTRTIKNISYYFKPAITWSLTSTLSFGGRFRPRGFIFDVNGMSLFAPSTRIESLLGLLNSKLSNQLLSIINPTMSFQSGDIARIPILPVTMYSKEIDNNVAICIKIACKDWDSFEASWDFQIPPLLREDLNAATIEESFNNWQAHCAANIKQMQELETDNNRLFIQAYGLQDELTPEVPEDQITLARADREADIKRLISYSIGCMMGRYSLDEPGLIYAHSGNKGFNPERYKSFPADPDGIVPIMETGWFADDAANRFVEFIGAAWPKEHLVENLKFIAVSLGPNKNEQPIDTIRRYLAAGFFKDHLKTYKKRPIYWLFSSGKQRAFQCLVYLHRYNEGTLARMRTEYVIPLQGKMAARIEHLPREIEQATSSSHRREMEKERGTLIKQQAELLAFDEKLRHYADMRIGLNLDDGVKVNYGKFGDLLAEVNAVTGGTAED